VTYGAETWTVTSKMEKMLMTWERKIMRKIYRTTKENGQWRIKTNEELITKYKAPDIGNILLFFFFLPRKSPSAVMP
jgi:hypothetical protein